jgi:uncharacterized protein YkwD
MEQRRRTRPRALSGVAGLWLGLAAACTEGAGGPRPTARAPGNLRGIDLGVARATPTDPPVAAYGADVVHALSPVEADLVERIATADIVHEPAVSAMAHALAASAPDHLNMPPALVDGLLAWFGLFDPPPRVVVVEIPKDADGCDRRVDGPCAAPIDALVEEVRKVAGADGASRFGVGVVPTPDGNTRMLAALVERAVELESVPRTFGPDRSVTIAGRLLGARSDPRLELIDPRGRWSKLATTTQGDGKFRAEVTCAHGRGEYQVEVLATGPHGPEVAANFPLICGGARPSEIRYEVESVAPHVGADDVARANFEWLAAERRRRGLPALQWDDRAARIALAHSRDMYEGGYVGHVSPTRGDVTSRFRAAELEAAVIRENVARGYGPKGMHESLMSSPGHRVNIVAEDVTHVGIGVVIGTPETDAEGAPRPMFLTQNFYKKPGAGAPRDLAAGARRTVDGRRKDAGLPPLTWDDRLSELAQKRSEAVARGREPDADLQQNVFALGFSALALHQVASSDHDALARVDVWMELRPEQVVGVGIARIPEGRPEHGFVMTIAVAER